VWCTQRDVWLIGADVLFFLLLVKSFMCHKKHKDSGEASSPDCGIFFGLKE
jgi:hypothetical protein